MPIDSGIAMPEFDRSTGTHLFDRSLLFYIRTLCTIESHPRSHLLGFHSRGNRCAFDAARLPQVAVRSQGCGPSAGAGSPVRFAFARRIRKRESNVGARTETGPRERADGHEERTACGAHSSRNLTPPVKVATQAKSRPRFCPEPSVQKSEFSRKRRLTSNNQVKFIFNMKALYEISYKRKKHLHKIIL
jgi:hypothetical protein